MPVIGITGGIATGKSSFCAHLGSVFPSATFYDADLAARELTESDPEVRESIVREFGLEIYLPSGGLDRKRLRGKVFADHNTRHVLEEILHPRIRAQWLAAASEARVKNEVFVADIPLLYETDGAKLCDWVAVVACSPASQLSRLLNRSKLMTTTLAKQIIESQMSLADKIARADHLIWNNGGASLLGRQAELLASLWRK